MKNMLLILVVFGFILIAIPTASIISTNKFESTAIAAEGTVLKTGSIFLGKNREIELTVSFNIKEGKTDTAILRRKQSTLIAGNKVQIYYDPANTKDIRSIDEMRKNITGIVFGVIIFLTSLFFYMKMVIRDIERKKLLKTGMKISADHITVDLNKSFSSKGKNPYVIKCQWVQNQTNKTFSFVSKDFWIDPKPHVSGRLFLDVYIDPEDPSKYYMDTSFMPRKG